MIWWIATVVFVAMFACQDASAYAVQQMVFSSGAEMNSAPSASIQNGTLRLASGLRPFTPLDMVTLDRLGPLVVAPDGKHAVFTRWHYNPESNKNSKSLWVMALPSGSGLRPLTEAVEGVSDDEPVWTANEELVFLRLHKERSNVAQLHQVRIPKGFVRAEAKIDTDETEFPGGRSKFPKVVELFPDHPLPIDVGNLKYSVAGQFLTFTAEVYANEQSSLEDTFERDKKLSKDFSSAMTFDKTYFRHWDTYDNHKNSHIFVLPLRSPVQPQKGANPAQLAVNILRGEKRYSSPVPPHGDASHYAISPAGDEIAFASMDAFEKNYQAWSTNTNIYTIGLTSDLTIGPIRCISCENQGADTVPVYSPDGSTLAWLEMRTPKYEADKNRLMMVDRASGKKVDLTKSMDRSVDSFILAKDGKTIYATVGDQGRTKIYALDTQNPGKTRVLVEENSNSALSLIPGTELLVFSKNSLSYPTEFFSVHTGSGDLLKLTSIHAEHMSQVETSPYEEFWFNGALEERVMGWYMKPAGFDPKKKYPLAFVIHGGPQSAWMDSFSTRWNLQAFAGAGFAVAVVNFHGSNTYGQKFTDSINKNWGSYPFEDLMKGLDFVLQQHPYIDADRIAGLGASYGGYMINWINGNTDRFRCLVNHDGLFDLRSMYYTTEELYFPEYEFGGTPYEQPDIYNKWSPSTFVANWKTPTLVIHGGKDYRVPQGEGFSTFTALQRLGVESRLLFFPDENHWVLKPANSLRWHKEVLQWITKFTTASK